MIAEVLQASAPTLLAPARTRSFRQGLPDRLVLDVVALPADTGPRHLAAAHGRRAVDDFEASAILEHDVADGQLERE